MDDITEISIGDLSNLGDLAVLTRRISMRIGSPPLEYVPGKTVIRDAVMDELGYSAERAEALVDLLEARGLIEFTGSSTALDLSPCSWRFRDHSR